MVGCLPIQEISIFVRPFNLSALKQISMKNYFLLTCIVLFSLTLQSQNLPAGATPIVYNRLIYVQGKADGKAGNFIFDTGADNLYFDTLFYSGNHFNYPDVTTSKLGGAGKKPQRVIVILDTVNFSFGNQVYRTPVVPVLKLKPITGDYADGILGAKCCSNAILEINYLQQFIKVHSTIDSVNLSRYSKINFEFVDDRILIPVSVTIHDTTKVNGFFLVDLGMGGTLSLSGTAANLYSLNKLFQRKYFHIQSKAESVANHQNIFLWPAPALLEGSHSVPYLLRSVLILPAQLRLQKNTWA